MADGSNTEGKERKPKGKPRVLIVEDDETHLKMLKRKVELHGKFNPVVAKNTVDALRILKEAKEEGHPFELVFCDLDLKDGVVDGGLQIAGTAKKDQLTKLFYLSTGQSDTVSLRYSPKQLQEMGVDRLISKSASAGALEEILDQAKEAISRPNPTVK